MPAARPPTTSQVAMGMRADGPRRDEMAIRLMHAPFVGVLASVSRPNLAPVRAWGLKECDTAMPAPASGAYVDVLDQAQSLAGGGGGEAGQVADLVDQVGLVGVAELVGDGAPARLAAERGLEGGAQPSDPGVLLWREAGRAAQRSLELPDPEPGVAGEARDGEVAAGGDDGAYGAAHDGVERRGVAQAGREPVVEDGRGLDGIRRDGCDRCGHVGRFGAEQLDCRGPGAAERFDRDAEDGGAGVRPEADPGHDDVA